MEILTVENIDGKKLVFGEEAKFISYVRGIFTENEEGEENGLTKPITFNEAFFYLRDYCDNLTLLPRGEGMLFGLSSILKKAIKKDFDIELGVIGGGDIDCKFENISAVVNKNIDPHCLDITIGLGKGISITEDSVVSDGLNWDSPVDVRTINSADEDDFDDYLIGLNSWLEKTVVNNRFTKAELNDLLQKKCGFISELQDIDESGLVGDNAYIVGILEHCGYVDIYYLNVPYGEKEIYVTEINVMNE